MPERSSPKQPRCKRPRRALFQAALAFVAAFVMAGVPMDALVGAPAAAWAQAPGLPTLPPLPDVPAMARDGLPGTVGTVTRLADVRRLRLRDLLRANRQTLESDPAGAPIVRHEVIAIAPSEAALTAARAAGFVVGPREALDGLDSALVTLRAPEGVSTRQALERLRARDPGGVYDFNHIYSESGIAADAAWTGARQGAGGAASGSASAGAVRVGLIDGGVNPHHRALVGAQVETRTFVGIAAPTLHGAAVASLLVGRTDTFHGAAPGGHLYAADVYGGLATGGSASAIARAFSWIALERVAVVNVSLVGPPNRALENVVAGMVARGFVIVAAVGNDGAAAAPLYPAAYPGVIGVTGVNAQGRALVEAGRGDQVDFAAPGADMIAADATGAFAPVRGTSFAAPIVAGLLAQRLAAPSPEGAARAVRELAATAEDLGERGRDRIYGAGLVGRALRTPGPLTITGAAARH